MAPSSSFASAVDPIALVRTECITITSALRKLCPYFLSLEQTSLESVGTIQAHHLDDYASHSGMPFASKPPPFCAEDNDTHDAGKWWRTHRFKCQNMQSQDASLVSLFDQLQTQLKHSEDIRSFDSPTLLYPFLQVLRSSTPVAITTLALLALTKIFSYRIIDEHSPRISLAAQLASSAITHCRFQASDSGSSEIALLRILRLMEDITTGPVGQLLGDINIQDIIKAGLKICSQVRASGVLRTSAENALAIICQTIFSRLPGLDVCLETEPARQDSLSLAYSTMLQQGLSMASEAATCADREQSRLGPSPKPIHDNNTFSMPANHDAGSDREAKPYSLNAIEEIFRVLIDLLDLDNRPRTDQTMIALRLISTALEIAGSHIMKHAYLACLVQNELCHHLFQLIRSNGENVVLLTKALRVTNTLFMTCRLALKLQQEHHLTYLVACICSGADIPSEPGILGDIYEQMGKYRENIGLYHCSPETKEAMIEAFCVLVGIPSFMVEVFINYDSEVARSDLCEDITRTLCWGALSGKDSSAVCLGTLLSYIQSMYDRLDDQAQTEGFPSCNDLRKQRETKALIIKGTQSFNENPKDAITFLSTHGILENPEDAVQVAQFLKTTSRLSKKAIGDFISKRTNEDVLNAFVNLHDFSGKFVVDALRELLSAIRLPGEAPLIERIMTSFSNKYIKDNESDLLDIADTDSLFVLAYAIIMLNTSLYNPNIKQVDRMAYDDFSRNLRGLNAGKDFAPEFQRNIYNNIQQREIIVPDEHANRDAFNHAWAEILSNSAPSGGLVVGETNLYDADMVNTTWKPLVATLSHLLSTSDYDVYSRAAIGLDQCVRLAARYGASKMFNAIISSLSSISTLATDMPMRITFNIEVQGVMVSELAVRFGHDLRAQLATVILFRVLASSTTTVRDSWRPIVRILRNLFINSLIPSFVHSSENGLDLPPIPLQEDPDSNRARTTTGLLSSVKSYIASYVADDLPEPSKEELDSTCCTVDCLRACLIDSVLSSIQSLPPHNLQAFVEAVLIQLGEERESVAMAEKQGGNNTHETNTTRYHPSMIYLLESAVILTLRDKETLGCLGGRLLGTLQNFVTDAKHVPSATLSQVITYLFKLLQLGYDQPFMQTTSIIQNIYVLDHKTLASVAAAAIKGLSLCLFQSKSLQEKVVILPEFWSILQRLHYHEEVASIILDILEKVITSPYSTITTSSYMSAISLADGFCRGATLAYLKTQEGTAHIGHTQATKEPDLRVDNAIAQGTTALGLVLPLAHQVSTLRGELAVVNAGEAWFAYWSPIFSCLAAQCISPCREIRHNAMASLQKLLLSVDTGSDEQWWLDVFDKVLFPLNLQLLEPAVIRLDLTGICKSHVQVTTVICKVFLRYMDQLQHQHAKGLDKNEDVPSLWFRTLDAFEQMAERGQGNVIEEVIREGIKNIGLVMADRGLLLPSKEHIWMGTKRILNGFLPDLFEELSSTIS